MSCLLFLLHLIVISTISATPGNETDRLALLEFKAKLNDPLHAFSSWNHTTHFCQWYGVSCGRRHQRVTVLDLQSLKLSGSLSPHIGNLSFLRDLNLQDNSLTGEIAMQIGHLQRLKRLLVRNNSIGGQIPSNISSCHSLVLIDLSNNTLEGTIPVEIGSLRKLKYLYVSTNYLTGTIPSSLGNSSSLQELYTYENYLLGNLPVTMGQLRNLTELGLNANQFSGTIPPSFYNLSSLTILDLGVNNLQGSLPQELGNVFPNIRFFSIGTNHFTGSIPVSISNASTLEVLQFQINNISGKVPNLGNLRNLRWFSVAVNQLGTGKINDLSFLSSLTNASALKSLEASDNNFGGKLPPQSSNLSTKLSTFTLYNNQISGSLPNGLENLANLEAFSAHHNKFSGIIPSEIGKLQKLQLLYLHANSFSGYIPSSLGNLTNLLEFDLSENKLHGGIPVSLGECQKLLEFNLSFNQLSGKIPTQIMMISALSIVLDLSSNHFSSVLPTEVGNLKSLGRLLLSNNKLSGEIPSSLGSCTTLQTLKMEGNSFGAQVPSSLSSLRGIEILDLSRNNLSGRIPEFFESLKSLQILNLSYNKFEGLVPIKGIFKNATIILVVGNSRLCGGLSEFNLPRCNFNKPNKRLTLKIKIIISSSVMISSGTLLLCCLYLFWSRKKSVELSSLSCNDKRFLQVSYQSLRRATNDFSSSNLIGTGSFASVYKGTLDQDGTIIAIKVFNLMREKATNSFIAECEMLRNIKHRNLVKVLTVCCSADYQGSDFKALVYEFMFNGSLDDWLHPNYSLDTTPKNLNFVQRLNIAIDIASALEYLHNHSEIPIVHCDMKPRNVLLDHEMTARVGDFGLAKFLSSDQDIPQSSANQSTSIGLRGTIGYTPPEYGMGVEVWRYGDIYSYGIILLEMFTGKKPTDEKFKEGLNLHNFVRMALPDQAMKIADPVILDPHLNVERINHKKNKQIFDCIALIFEIGISCSLQQPNHRMQIADVVAQLHRIRKKLIVPTQDKRNTGKNASRPSTPNSCSSSILIAQKVDE